MILRIRQPFKVYYHVFQEIFGQAHKEIQLTGKALMNLGSLQKYIFQIPKEIHV